MYILILISLALIFAEAEEDIYSCYKQTSEKYNTPGDVCCETNKLITSYESTTNCYNEILQNQAANESSPLQFGACLSECLVKSAFIEDGLKQDLLQDLILQRYKIEGPALEAIENSVKVCSEHTAEILNTIPKTDVKKKFACSPYGLIFLSCLDGDLLINCPADKWNATKNCEALRTFQKKCFFPMLKMF